MSHLPVVFIPGLGGSFNLPVLLDWRSPTINDWNFPPFINYGTTFVNAFQSAGYTRDRDLFVAFYDWRKSVSDSATTYLIPWIDRARARSGSGKVVLVGHSMGGLVARSYIQSNRYHDRGDVDRLITLGTPHRGSANAYYPWEGGELRWDSTVKTVLEVYLWYLQHAHPFQTGLNRLKTVRTQVPGLRDLLPIDDYLTTQGPPPKPLPELSMHERNLAGEVLDSAAGRSILFERVPVTTFSGIGFETVQSIAVQAPVASSDDPPSYPDGRPLHDQADGNGDGTVKLTSAQLADPRVNNLPPVHVVHDQMPDMIVAQVLALLGATVPAVSPPVAVPSMVILTASPVQMSVELLAPAAPANVLGAAEAAAPRRRRRAQRVRVFDYGHSGKHLNMAVIPQPEIGSYAVRLRGTATGTFALGALMVGVQSTVVQSAAAQGAVLGAEERSDVVMQQPAVSQIATVHGKVADQTELLYQVECKSYTAPPEVRFDAPATARDALARLSAAAQSAAGPTAPGVLSAEANASSAHVLSVLSAADTSDPLRATLGAALTQGDERAIQDTAAILGSPAGSEQARALLSSVTKQLVGAHNQALAIGLLEQLNQVAEQRSES